MVERRELKRANGSGGDNEQAIANALVTSVAQGPEMPEAEVFAAMSAEFTRDMQQLVIGFINVGHKLEAWKEELRARYGHGSFRRFVDTLPYSWRTVDYLMKIAKHPVIGDSQYVANLPPSWATLSELCDIDDHDAIKEMIAEGRINPDLSRSEARDLASEVKRHNVGNLANLRDAIAVLFKFEEKYPDPATISETLWREMSTDLRTYVDTHTIKRAADWLGRLHAVIPANRHQEAYLLSLRKPKRKRHRYRRVRPRRGLLMKSDFSNVIEEDEIDAPPEAANA